ncbi:MAG TPA: riboflavin synthase [Polyangia bacterium]|jgi:riboflavin synthase
MFTGIVEDVGKIRALEALPSEQALRLTVSASLLDDEQPLGASLAVDGVCLTVTAWRRGEVEAVVGPETVARTTLGKLGAGASVNLERPLRLGDRLGGHMVAGHVDAVGHIVQVAPRAEAVDVTVRAPGELLRYVIEKGSIAVDGISLTVNGVDAESFTVSLIPHTQSATTLAQKGAGAPVNLEVDLIGKYVEKLVEGYKR